MSAELQVFAAIAARLSPGGSGWRLHATLSGALCADRDGALARLDALAELLGIRAQALSRDALRAACAQVEARLREPDLGYAPLLPDDESPLAERVRALAEWCEAFVDGFSVLRGEARVRLSPESEELLVDISAIAGELEPESLAQGSEDDERDYAEIVEFLRIAVISLYTENARLGAPGTH